jgi:hypothetical protein
MNLNNVSFPYPVLGSFDDILPAPPDPVVVLNEDDDSYHFDIQLTYDNEDIKRLVKSDYADYVCEVSCDLTRFRTCYKSKDLHFVVDIPRRTVGGRINFACTITVKRPILNYDNSGFHPDYYGHRFNMEPGDLLGFFAPFSYDVDIKYDQLKTVGTFMEITPTDDEWPSTILNKDKIELRLPQILYDYYKDNPAVNSQAEILHASVVLNSLIYALCRIDQYEDRLWAKTIEYRINTEKELAEFKDQDSDDWRVDKLSQILLGKPYERLFNHLVKNTNAE